MLETSSSVAAAVVIASNVYSPTGTTPAVSSTQDMGQCCIIFANVAEAGYGNPTWASAAQKLYNKFTCAARWTNDAAG